MIHERRRILVWMGRGLGAEARLVTMRLAGDKALSGTLDIVLG